MWGLTQGSVTRVRACCCASTFVMLQYPGATIHIGQATDCKLCKPTWASKEVSLLLVTYCSALAGGQQKLVMK